MSRGSRYPAESVNYQDSRTGVRIRQVTDHPSIHHHPIFIVPAYDDAMERLIFVSHRTGRPEIFAEERASGELIQLTERDHLSEYSIYPSHDGRYVYFTAGSSAWRVHTESFETEMLVDFGAVALKEAGMVASAMGTTALSANDRWWAVRFSVGDEASIAVIDTETLEYQVILQRDSVAHMMFCPDDDTLLYYAGPLKDRVWLINRDGSDNRRLYQRKAGEWITHEVWIPGTKELAFVDWPHGIRCVHADSERERRVTSFNAWHAICNRDGSLMVADTNYPDRGLQLFNPLDGVGSPEVICFPGASNMGEHWAGPFPYEHGPINVNAPQHTHPHPSFSPDSRHIVFTSDQTGYAQVYEAEIPTDMIGRIKHGS
ncbi:MAG: PD40 domain-containing protein [Trueperaceae bacterium]|nr:MAG: PD40 domain-containing protein [Trueperaceae bacterium]